MAKYRYSRSSSPFDDAKNMYILIGVCAAVVVAALVLCLTLQKDRPEPEIPVVEQGDGSEDLPGYDSVTSMGDIIIDDGGAPVDEFTVDVSGADGVYKLGDDSSLTISGQSASSFSFDLTSPGGSLSGIAYFNGERSAICEKAAGSVNFAFDAGAVYLTTEGTVDELGDSSVEGLFILDKSASPAVSGSDATTTTTTTTTTAAPAGKTYDLDIIKSEGVKSALSGMMSSGDYNLTLDLLNAQGGYGIIYGTGDSSKEKQGRQFNLDTQLNAVMYYSFESGTGREVVVLCADGGKVYAGVCDGSEYRYYTNDSGRKNAADAPNYIAQYAKIKGLSLKSQ